MAKFKINNVDDSALGLMFLDGTYNELLKMPKAKDTLVNDWKDQHGTERDLIGRVYETRTINLPVHLKGSNVADYLAKKQAFNAMMLAGSFNLKVTELNRQFNLVYSDTTNFRSEATWCSFTLVVFDDEPQLNTPIV